MDRERGCRRVVEVTFLLLYQHPMLQRSVNVIACSRLGRHMPHMQMPPPKTGRLACSGRLSVRLYLSCHSKQIGSLSTAGRLDSSPEAHFHRSRGANAQAKFSILNPKPQLRPYQSFPDNILLCYILLEYVSVYYSIL